MGNAPREGLSYNLFRNKRPLYKRPTDSPFNLHPFQFGYCKKKKSNHTNSFYKNLDSDEFENIFKG